MEKAAIGAMAPLRENGDSFRDVRELGLSVCQLVSWEEGFWSPDCARRVVEHASRDGVRVSAFWAGWPGPRVWDFLEGPQTLGIVPRAHRQPRVAALKKAGEFARLIGTPAIITHLGFIPENPNDPVFGEVVEAVRDIARHLATLGMQFWFETGQETPVTMLRLIQAVGTDNLGVNLDPANLVMYGKANAVDALDLLGPYVKNVHAKDGVYPVDPMRLGAEVKVGQGRVDWPRLMTRLSEVGYRGELIIEREISGGQQRKDIIETVAYLRGLLS